MSHEFLIIILKIIAILMLIAFCCRLRRIDFNSIFDTIIVSIPSAILGGRIYYILININKYKSNIIDMFNISKGGFDLTGIMIGAFIGAWIYTVYRRYSLLDFMDIIAPSLPLIDMFFGTFQLRFCVNIFLIMILMFITKISRRSGVIITIYLIMMFIINLI